MADDEDASRQEKLAAARKRFEELKKQQEKKPAKKKAGKKGKPDQDAKVEADTPERVDSPATVSGDVETSLPAVAAEEPAEEPVEETADVAGDAVQEEHKEEVENVLEKDGESTSEPAVTEAISEPVPENIAQPSIADLQARLNVLELENSALRDSLSTANAKIQLDAQTIASLQARISGAPGSPAKQDDDYKDLQEKFSREAQERYLLERDYAALDRNYEKLVASHAALKAELDKLKKQFSADEKRRQTANTEQLATDEKQLLAARDRAANINARISAGTSSFFRTAQGLSAAVVKGVTGGASAVIADAPAMARRVSTGTAKSRQRTGSSASYADIDLYADDEVPDDEDADENDELARQRLLERERLATEQRERNDIEEDANAERMEWLIEEMKKWKGFQLDLVKTGGSPAGLGPIFVV